MDFSEDGVTPAAAEVVVRLLSTGETVNNDLRAATWLQWSTWKKDVTNTTSWLLEVRVIVAARSSRRSKRWLARLRSFDVAAR
jgi:hypothetical protein